MGAANGIGTTASINVTPLVDVCLVLLIIFMVVTPMLNGDGIEIPQTRRPALEPREKGDLIVVVAAKSGYRLDGENVDLGTLRRRLLELHEREPLRKVRLRADRRSSWRQVREAMTSLASSGFETAALITERKDVP